MKSVRNPKFGTGAIPASMFPKNTTVRPVRVSQRDSVAILAAKKAGQLALAKGRPIVETNIRPQPQDASRVMSEQQKQALRSGSKMINKTPYGTR